MIIVVRGTPAPQGSKRHVGGGRMVEMSKAVGPWREAVRAQTQTAMAEARKRPLEGPVSVHVFFYLPKPKSAPKSLLVPAKRPDVDKLARAVLDGLTEGGAFADDGQVVSLTAMKLYAVECPPGATIEVGEFVQMQAPMHGPPAETISEFCLRSPKFHCRDGQHCSCRACHDAGRLSKFPDLSGNAEKSTA